MIEISQAPRDDRSVPHAMWRGWRLRCPRCGIGRMFHGYLKVSDACPHCNEELHHHRADDAPPYFTMFITGHVIISGVMLLEQAYAPATWVHAIVWLPILILLSLWLLPRVKGALVGLQWALRMHGFEAGSIDSRARAAEPTPSAPVGSP